MHNWSISCCPENGKYSLFLKCFIFLTLYNLYYFYWILNPKEQHNNILCFLLNDVSLQPALTSFQRPMIYGSSVFIAEQILFYAQLVSILLGIYLPRFWTRKLPPYIYNFTKIGRWLQSFTSAADAFDLCWKMQQGIKLFFRRGLVHQDIIP